MALPENPFIDGIPREVVIVINPDGTPAGGSEFASDGTTLPASSLAPTLNYDPVSGALASITVTFKGVVYKKSFTYTANSTSISLWTPQ